MSAVPGVDPTAFLMRVLDVTTRVLVDELPLTDEPPLTGEPRPTEVMTAYKWRSNAHMLADLRRIMPFPEGPSIDLTYGLGKWWEPTVNPAPDGMVRCIGPHTRPTAPHDLVIDFTASPFPDDSFAVTAFDPPYVLKGADAQFAGMNAAYGIDTTTMRARTATDRLPIVPRWITDVTSNVNEVEIARLLATVTLPPGVTADISSKRGYDGESHVYLLRGDLRCGGKMLAALEGEWDGIWTVSSHNGNPEREYYCGTLLEALESVLGRLERKSTRKQALEALIVDGLTEAARITQPGGWILAKAGRGVDGGKVFATDDLMVRTGHDLGLVEVTSLWLLSPPRSQAHRGPQKTPRANVSRLTVFEVPS